MDPSLTELYGNRVRVRVCGVCWRDDSLLMVNHKGIMPGHFWAPPGGGVALGESVHDCLRREFTEETGLDVRVGRFLFACEFIRDPLHAIELFFEVSISGGVLQKGDDPEFPTIDEVRFMSVAEISLLSDEHRHGIFRLIPSPGDLKTLNGFFRI